MATFIKCFLVISLAFVCLSSSNAQTNITLRVASVLDVPYLIEENGKFVGIVPDLLDELPYNYSIYIPSDDMYGSQRSDGSWTGMIGELVDRKADLAGLFTITGRRSEAVDISYPVMSASPSILMKKPERMTQSLQDNLSKLLYPFEVSVWLASFLALLVTSIVLYIMMHFNPYEWRRMARDHEATLREGESFTCLNTFFFVASTLMWQGYVKAPRSIGARVLVVAWWAFTVIFIVSYTASLTNYLRSSPELFSFKEYTKIKDFRDLANNDDIRVGLLPAGSTHRFFQESESPVYQQIYERVIADPSYGNLTSTYSLVKYLRNMPYAEYAVILESTNAKYHSIRKPCNLYAINIGFSNKHYAFGLQKNSQITDEINKVLIRLSETGKLHEIEQKWFKSECSDAVMSTQSSDTEIVIPAFDRLGLGTFSTALLIVVAGIVIGGIICIIEICIYKIVETNATDDEAERIQTDPQINETLLKTDEKKGTTQV